MVDTASGFGALSPDQIIKLMPNATQESNPVSVRCPRFSPEGDFLVILGSPRMRVHQGASNLYMITNLSQLDECKYELLLNGKDEATLDNGERFPGLFVQDLPKTCFTGGGKHALKVVFSTAWHSSVRVMAVDVATKRLEAVSAFETCVQPGSVLGLNNGDHVKVLERQTVDAKVLGVCSISGTVVVAYSSPTNPGNTFKLYPIAVTMSLSIS